AAMPPSIVVFCTIVTSAWTMAEHTITTRSVPNQRFMKASWPEAEGRAGLAAARVMTSAAELGDVARLLAGIAAVFPEGAVGRDGAGASRMCAFLFHGVLLRLTSPYCTPRPAAAAQAWAADGNRRDPQAHRDVRVRVSPRGRAPITFGDASID